MFPFFEKGIIKIMQKISKSTIYIIAIIIIIILVIVGIFYFQTIKKQIKPAPEGTQNEEAPPFEVEEDEGIMQDEEAPPFE